MFNRSMKEKSPFSKNIKRFMKFRLEVFLPSEKHSQITMHSVGLENSKIKKHKKGHEIPSWSVSPGWESLANYNAFCRSREQQNQKTKKGSRNSGWVPFLWFQYCMQQPMQRTLQTNHDPPAVKISLFFSEIAYSKQSISKECEHTDEWPMCTGVPWSDQVYPRTKAWHGIS